MLTTLKTKEGVVSTANPNGVKKGNQGRLEFSVLSDGDNGFYLDFADYGNFGKRRWKASAPLDADNLDGIIKVLTLLREGQIESTHVPFEAALIKPESALIDEASLDDYDEDEVDASVLAQSSLNIVDENVDAVSA